MSKNIFIPNVLHEELRTWCFHNHKTITLAVMEAIAAMMNSNPITAESALRVPSEIVIPQKSPGRPSKRLSSFVRCPEEVELLQAGDNIPETLAWRDPRPLAIKLQSLGYFFEALNEETTVLCSLAMSVEKSGNMLIQDKFEIVRSFDGLENLIEVKQDGEAYQPVNDMARMVLALQPGRPAFDKFILFYLYTYGLFSIKYLP